MALTYEPIQTISVTGTSTAMFFSNIPQTYTDLRVVLYANVTANTSIFWRYNQDSGTNYGQTAINTNGNTAGSNRTSTQNANMIVTGFQSKSGYPLMAIIDTFSYTSTSIYKVSLCSYSQDRDTDFGTAEMNSGTWRSNSAVTRIDVFVTSSSMAAGTTATLYGIKKA